MKFKATEMGVLPSGRVRPGEEFDLEVPEGVKPPSWAEPVEDDAPAVVKEDDAPDDPEGDEPEDSEADEE